MGKLTNYIVVREPDLPLNVRGKERGWQMLPSSRSASHASPIAGQLLTPRQLANLSPLANAKDSTKSSRDDLFDPLYEVFETAFREHDLAKMEQTASAFLRQHPIESALASGSAENAISSFFRYKGARSTAGERLSLIDGFSREELEAWREDAPRRVDLNKAQALATAVAGLEPPAGIDLLGSLHADLAFAMLDASLCSLSPSDDRAAAATKYVDHILSMPAFLPPFVFVLKPCKLRGSSKGESKGFLSSRLERLKSYETRLNTVAKSVASKSDAQVNAAGTLGHRSDCDCKCDDGKCVPIDPCCGEIRWYVTELLTLEDHTWCYKPSNLAYIENVAPYETRVRTHSFSRNVTETSEDETNSSREEQRDHQVTDRFDLQQEIERNNKASLDVDAKLKYGSDKGPYSFELNASGSLSKESAYREARESVREQVEKATLKIQVQTRHLRSRTVATQSSEVNKHKFKNITAIAAVTKYFWVTHVKRGQLFSHGPRLTVDMLVPSPAMLFRKMEQTKRKGGEPTGPGKAPAKPTLAPNEITRDNYVALATQYGVTGYDPPPPALAVKTLGIQGTANEGSVQVTIPTGYTATKMDLTSEDVKPRYSTYWISLKFGGQEIQYTVGTGATPGSVSLSESSSGQATITKHALALKKSSIGAVLTLTPDGVDLSPWQQSIYALIMKKYADEFEAYEAQRADYEAALAAYNEKIDAASTGRHPFACEELMRTELKRSAIFMMCGEFDWPGVMNMDSEMCHFPWPNRTKANEATNEWYFFDRAFDWNLASFTFYDYFRNPLCKWVDTYEPDESNFLFKAFLRAGYSRVQIPVSPGMEDDVRDYLQTGGLWGNTGTWPHDPSDPRWISVIEEIKHAHDCYQQDREGYVEAYLDLGGSGFDSHVRVFTDRYWDVGFGTIDQDAINLELDHQIYIDGIEYRIISLVPDPNSAPYSPMTSSTMSWVIGLDRKIEFEPYVDPAATTPLLKPYNYAIGAKYIGAPFHFDLPTDLIWIGDQGNACLPCYPITCDGEGQGDEIDGGE